MKHEQFISGDYVFTPCKNAFNKKISYWISKKNYTMALYAFTPMDSSDLKYHKSKEVVDSYIRYYEDKLQESRLAKQRAE